MISGGNQIISRTFRRGTGQNRSRDLHEVQSIHSLTQFCHDLASHHDIFLHVRISQIQVTVFQTCILVCILGLINFKGKCIVNTLSQNLDLIGYYLDLTGRQISIFAGTLSYYTFHGDGGFLVDAIHDIHHFLGLYYQLGGSVEITQNDKTEIFADFSHVLEPANQCDSLTDVADPKFITVMCSGLNHCFCSLSVAFISLILPYRIPRILRSLPYSAVPSGISCSCSCGLPVPGYRPYGLPAPVQSLHTTFRH